MTKEFKEILAIFMANDIHFFLQHSKIFYRSWIAPNKEYSLRSWEIDDRPSGKPQFYLNHKLYVGNLETFIKTIKEI